MPDVQFICIECGEPLTDDHHKAAGLCPDCLAECVENHDYSVETD